MTSIAARRRSHAAPSVNTGRVPAGCNLGGIPRRRIRAALIRKIRYSIPLDLLDALLMGVRGSLKRR